MPKLKAEPVLLLAPNPVPVLLPNPPLPPPKLGVDVVVLPKRPGAVEVLVLPNGAGLFPPKIDELALFVEPNPAEE